MSELLSISIPTRNRAKCLSDLLSDIRSSIAHGKIDTSLLKIYIFDNASTDDTKQCVDTFKASLPISYTRSKENIGMGLNIFKAYTAIGGEYVWVIGDDELLPRNALSLIINLIKKCSPGLIIPRELSYKGIVELPLQYSSYTDFSESMQVHNPHYLIAHSLISANVIKRSFFDKNFAMSKIDTYYGHMYGIAMGLKKNIGLIILPKESTIIVRKLYLGAVDGFWPDSIEQEQVIYLEWLKKEFNLTINSARVIPDYRAKFMPNILIRGMNFIHRRVISKLRLFK